MIYVGLRRLCAIFLLAAGLSATLNAVAAETGRGLTLPLRASETRGAAITEEVTLYGSSHAMVIGIDDYTDGWPRLSKAVEDARRVAEELRRKGFRVTLKTNTKSSDLDGVLKEFFAIKGADPNSRLFLWYAGHGHTEHGEGFLVPADAPRPEAAGLFRLKALSLRRIGEYVRLARSKHVFSVFDSCFSGTVFDSARGLPPATITRATTLPVRQFLTSGDAGQTVSDDGAFRELFLRVLRGEERADANGDGYVTAAEIGLFLTDRVTNLTRSKQTPRYGKLRDKDWDRGDFVFALSKSSRPGSTAQRTPPTAAGTSPEILFWQSIQNATNPAVFEAYLNQFPNGTFAALARIKIAELKGRSTAALTPPAATAPSGTAGILSVSDIVGRIKHAVVGVAASAKDGKTETVGSGFIVSPLGHVATNNHLIDEASKIVAFLADGTRLPVTVTGRDKRTDIAVLKVAQPPAGPPIRWAAAELGGRVVAVAMSPAGGNVIIATGKVEQVGVATQYNQFIQINTAIEPRHSGAPVLNDRGEIVGLATAIEQKKKTKRQIGFAIPTKVMRSVVRQLIEFGRVKRGWLGVQIQKVTDELANTIDLGKARGALVARVSESSPAKAAGLKSGDVILDFAGIEIVEMRTLPGIVAAQPIGGTTDLTVWRDKRRLGLKVRLEELTDAKMAALSKTTPKTTPTPKTGQQLDEFGFTLSPGPKKGVIITKVAKKSVAATKGLRAGDIILELNQKPVSTPTGIVDGLAESRRRGRKSVLVLVEGQGGLRFVALKLAAGATRQDEAEREETETETETEENSD